MARSRLLKPGFFLNERLAECPYEGRLLFAGLWTLADREGRLEDRPARIKAAIFPFDAVAIDDLLAGLAERGFITRYHAEAVAVIQITKFHEHQSPHLRESASVLPEHGLGCAQASPRSPVSVSVLVSDPVSVSVNSSAPPAAASEPSVLEFPCVGANVSWRLSEAQCAEWATAYPNLDVRAECRKAHAWLRANMNRRKTSRGMPAFLVNWLNRAADRGDVRQKPAKSNLFSHEPFRCPHTPRCSGGRAECDTRIKLDAFKAAERAS